MQDITISDFQEFPKGQFPARVSSACIQCRLRHVKCGAESPICSRCQTKGEHCVYQKSRRGGRRAKKPLQSHDNSLNFIPSGFEMLRTQPPADFFSSGLVENSSRAESSTDSSSNDPGLNGPNPAVGRTMISVEGSPINSNRSTRAGIVSQTSQEATDNLLDSYYTNFHPAHPCALPRLFFKRRLEVDPLGLLPVLLVMQYIGSLYTPSTSYAHLEAQVQEALVRDTTAAPISAAYQVQALILYAIAAYWCDEVERGLRLLDDAISRAVNLGMNLRVFAAKYGGGDPILEESWRRTWWLIYITDAHTSGSTHVYPFRTTSITTSVELPCEEESYASGVCLCLPEHVYNFVNFRVEKSIPQPRTLCEYEMREFAEDDGREFSSFAELVGLVRSLSTVFSRGRRPDSDSASTIAADFDASMMGWRSLLVQSERRILQIDGTIDEHLFRATMLMNTYIVDIHRPLSTLSYSTVESASRCAPPPPPGCTPTNESALSRVHTSKIIRGIEAVNELLTLSTSLKAHSPFTICMISNTTIAYLAACRYVLRDQALKLAREKIRLNMGVLKTLGEYWPLAKRTYREVGIIAREILCLEDQYIALPVRDSLQEPTNYATNPLIFDFNSTIGLINFEDLGSMDL